METKNDLVRFWQGFGHADDYKTVQDTKALRGPLLSRASGRRTMCFSDRCVRIFGNGMDAIRIAERCTWKVRGIYVNLFVYFISQIYFLKLFSR